MDPRLVAKQGPLGHEYYHDSVTGKVFLHQRQYEEIKGGVLAESMGRIRSAEWTIISADC